MISKNRTYKLIRDFGKIRFISHDDFLQQKDDNYSEVHQRQRFTTNQIQNLKDQYSRIPTPLTRILNDNDLTTFNVIDYGGGLAKGYYQLPLELRKKCNTWQIIERTDFIENVKICLLVANEDINIKFEILPVLSLAGQFLLYLIFHWQT